MGTPYTPEQFDIDLHESLRLKRIRRHLEPSAKYAERVPQCDGKCEHPVVLIALNDDGSGLTCCAFVNARAELKVVKALEAALRERMARGRAQLTFEDKRVAQRGERNSGLFKRFHRTFTGTHRLRKLTLPRGVKLPGDEGGE